MAWWQWEADPEFWERVFMESKGLCLDRAQAGGLWWRAQRAPGQAQENFSTIKEPLINPTYVPKLHMRRMIPIRLKPNSVQAQIHISSAIPFFVFTGQSLTTGPLFFYQTLRNAACIDTVILTSKLLFNMFLMEMQARGSDCKQLSI